VICNKTKHKQLFLFIFFFSDLSSLFLCLSFFPSSGGGQLWGQGVRGLWLAILCILSCFGLLDLEPSFVARATDRPHVGMARLATSLLLLHFYTCIVVHRRHGWEIGAPSSFDFLLPTFYWLSFGWFCGGQKSREAELWWGCSGGWVSGKRGRSCGWPGEGCWVWKWWWVRENGAGEESGAGEEGRWVVEMEWPRGFFFFLRKGGPFTEKMGMRVVCWKLKIC